MAGGSDYRPVVPAAFAFVSQLRLCAAALQGSRERTYYAKRLAKG